MKYSTALAEKIAERVAAGDLLRDVAKAKDMPLLETLRRWRKRHEEFAKLLAEAFTESAETLVTEMADIRAELKGELDLGACRSAEIRLRNLTWLVSKLDKERYGDRQQVEVTGLPVVRITSYTGLGPEELAAVDKVRSRKGYRPLERPKVEPIVLPAEVLADEPPRRRRLQVDV